MLRDATPEQLGDYRLGDRLGAGAMGEVFAARHRTSGEHVALKRLIGVDATSLYRFKREFRALADVDHPNLVRLGDLVIVAEGPAFFTMELVDGEPFDEYVRRRTPSDEPPNLVRLVRAFRQLVAGVAHLHRTGTLHRDLKPSNVLVTREGRVVILDFGLISERGDPEVEVGGDGQLLGTPAYMAPEQGGRGPLGPAVDLYALGVMLHQCLTGRLPFTGSPLQLLLDKQNLEVANPCTIVAEIPAELGALCVRLLAIDPAARPDCDTVLEQLARASPHSAALPVAGLGRADVFVGRERELAVLDAGLLAIRDGHRAVTVLVRGPSGIGKSAMIGRFLTEAIERSDALVLRGRCFERESVPFKGVDAVIDALSAYLRRLPDGDAVRYQPQRVGALVKIFPVLADAWPSHRHRESLQSDLHHLRRLGVAALREVLVRIADDRPLIVHVEDFQWADVDGARLLTELARPPDAPPMLLIVSFRNSLHAEGESSEALRELISTEALAERQVERIELEPLSDHEANALAHALVTPSSDETERRVEHQTKLAKGNPFFLRQLLSEGVLSASTRAAETEGSLDTVVAHRIVQLPARARRLLAIVAVAGGPSSEAAVLELEPGIEATTELAMLVELGLLHRERRGLGTVLEAAHDRIREVMVAELDTAELRALHADLGRVLVGHAAPPELLAEHFERGGDPTRALHYVELAAAQAAAGLGFARAADLYRRASRLAREVAEPARHERLEAALADQLSYLGRSAEAAELFLALVPCASEQAQVMMFRRQAIDHLIKSGQIDRGLDALESALATFGEGLPRSPGATILSFLRHRLRLLWRGSKFEVRTADQLDPYTIEYLATVLAGTLGLMSQEMLITTALHARLLHASLDAGEPYHLACALMWEMVLSINGGMDRRARALRKRVRGLAAGSDDPMVIGIAAANDASYSYMSRQWADADVEWGHLLTIIDDIPGLGWLRAMRTFSAHTKLALGSFATLRQRLPDWTHEASQSGSQQEAAEMLALSGLVELFTGNLDTARQLIDEGRSLWHMPRYTFPEFYLDFSEIPLLLAAHEYARAATQIERSLAAARRWQVHRIVLARDDLLDLHARSFALLGIQADDAHARRRARSSARRLARVAHPTSKGRAAVVHAALTERREQAEVHWQVALHHFAASGMRAHHAAVSIRLAGIREGDEAIRLRADAEAYFDAESIREPQRMVDVVAPAPKWLDRST
jgi:hypothetical protein